MPSDRERRVEPWPIALALALALMIGICVAFFVIAQANPDPVITRDARPGMER
ncbi:MAG TPA: hypothetical protein VIY27_09305 [Myxococcota bacterium]